MVLLSLLVGALLLLSQYKILINTMEETTKDGMQELYEKFSVTKLENKIIVTNTGQL